MYRRGQEGQAILRRPQRMVIRARSPRPASRREGDQTACKPGSVSPPCKHEDAAVIPLDRPLPDGSRDLPGRLGRRRPAPLARDAAPLFGLAPGGACHAVPVTRSAVGSYPTLSPLPILCLDFGGRFAFCGAVPGVAPGGRYPPPCRRGARTFLPPFRRSRGSRRATAQPSDLGARWARVASASRRPWARAPSWPLAGPASNRAEARG